MRTSIIIILFFTFTSSISQSLFEEKLFHKMEKASLLFKSGEKEKAIKIWLKVEKKAKKSSSLYGKVLRNLLYYYSQGNEEINLLNTYKKIIVFELNDDEKRRDVGASFSNFKYHSTIQLASYYKNKGFYKKALYYIEKADNTLVYNTKSISTFANKKIDLAIWKYWIHKELKEDNKAIIVLIKRAFEYNYKAQYHKWYLDSKQNNEQQLLELILENTENLTTLKDEVEEMVKTASSVKNNNKTIFLRYKNNNILIKTFQEFSSYEERVAFLKNSYFYKQLQRTKTLLEKED